MRKLLRKSSTGACWSPCWMEFLKATQKISKQIIRNHCFVLKEQTISQLCLELEISIAQQTTAWKNHFSCICLHRSRVKFRWLHPIKWKWSMKRSLSQIITCLYNSRTQKSHKPMKKEEWCEALIIKLKLLTETME